MKTSREKYLESRITDAEEQLAKYRGSRLLRCEHCNRASQIKLWVLSAVQFYVRPHGCTGGDYWKFCDPPEYQATCPKCKKMTEYHEFVDDQDAYALVCELNNHFKQGELVQDNG